MAPTSTGGVATDASAAANPAAEPPRQVAVPPDAWLEDMAPIGAADWNYARARHLLDRAGFGGTPDDIVRLARMTPEAAVLSLVDYQGIENGQLTPFEHSGIYDPTLNPFPPTRPAATRLAAGTGAAMGIAIKPSGARKLQPVANRFFYWLRASALETRRVANWWADRMWSRPSGRLRRRWRCSGTATSPAAGTRCVTTARCWARSHCSSVSPPAISETC